MENWHRLSFAIYEEGKLTLEEYLGRVVFYKIRPFTRAQFRRVMFAQLKPYPEMIELVRSRKATYGMKIALVSNEAGELNAYQIRMFKLDGLVAAWISSCFVHLRKPEADLFRLGWTSPRRQSGRPSISKTPRCSSRSRKGWGFEAFFTRITVPHARNWLHWGCRMMEDSPMNPGNPPILTINGGSSSIKFSLFWAGASLRRILDGVISAAAGRVVRPI